MIVLLKVTTIVIPRRSNIRPSRKKENHRRLLLAVGVEFQTAGEEKKIFVVRRSSNDCAVFMFLSSSLSGLFLSYLERLVLRSILMGNLFEERIERWIFFMMKKDILWKCLLPIPHGEE